MIKIGPRKERLLGLNKYEVLLQFFLQPNREQPITDKLLEVGKDLN